MNIAIVGEGAWGSAMACLFADAGHTVHLWCYDAAVCTEIMRHRTNNKFLPGITFAQTIHPSTCYNDIFNDVTFACEAIPVPYLRSVLNTIPPTGRTIPWICLSKGIEQTTHLLVHEIIADVFDPRVAIGLLAGPSFAHQLVRKDSTGFTCTTHDNALYQLIHDACATAYTIVTHTTDMTGVALLSALKNVIAIGMGIIRGAGMHENAQGLLLWRAVHELKHIISACGGDISSIYSLAGIGDLVMTSMSTESRNVRFGMLLGEGKTHDEAFHHVASTAEGVATTASIIEIVQKHALHLPLIETIFAIVWQGASPALFHDILVQPIHET